jgi:RecJ-like exonuclease
MEVNMVNCKICGKEIAKSAKVCPHCGAKNKKPIYKRIWVWLLGVIIVFGGLMSCGSEDTSTNDTNSSYSESENAEKETITYTSVVIGDMFDELKNNALSAEKKYNNLNVEFTGTLETIDSDGEYVSVIDLYDDSWGFDSIHCSIENDEQLNVIMTKSKGDEVFVQGEITEVGEIMGYTLTMHTIK